MSRICDITGKKPSVGNKRSHAMNATLRRFNPNLFVKKVKDPKTGRMVKMKVSARALRILDRMS
ncbi:50S ribosomal protein L28 [Candidatus Peregrinibacteria bacterium]|nr:50S ribosomal protein L28 [Candidatus Peregrinibacteria bacterium]